MTQPAKSQEPSMEEILASIRRIIADDDATKSVPPSAEAAKPAVAARPAPSRPPVAPAHVDPPEASFSGAHSAADSGSASSAPAEQSSDILDLTESMASEMPPAPSPPPMPSPMPEPAPQFRTIDGSFDVSYEEAAERPAPARPEVRSDDRAQLMSSLTSAAVDSAFNTLAQTVLVQNARTLEDLVREMLRPMLKSWLDDNLPGMVERLVRAEIERVSRGRMG
jgi:uncharacterized protein